MTIYSYIDYHLSVNNSNKRQTHKLGNKYERIGKSGGICDMMVNLEFLCFKQMNVLF